MIFVVHRYENGNKSCLLQCLYHCLSSMELLITIWIETGIIPSMHLSSTISFLKLSLRKEINIFIRDHHAIICKYSCVLMWSWLQNVKLEKLLACSSTTTQVFTLTIISYLFLFFFVLDVDRQISSSDFSLQKQDCTNKHKLHTSTR